MRVTSSRACGFTARSSARPAPWRSRGTLPAGDRARRPSFAPDVVVMARLARLDTSASTCPARIVNMPGLIGKRLVGRLPARPSARPSTSSASVIDRASLRKVRYEQRRARARDISGVPATRSWTRSSAASRRPRCRSTPLATRALHADVDLGSPRRHARRARSSMLSARRARPRRTCLKPRA